MSAFYTIDTIAGRSTSAGLKNNLPARQTYLNHPSGIWVTSLGDLFVTDTDSCLIRKITATTQTASIIVGTKTCGNSTEGAPATSTDISYPYSIWVNTIGDIYFTSINKIQKINHSSARITTVAGSATIDNTYQDHVAATSTYIFHSMGIWGDSLGHELYFTQTGNNTIRNISLSTGGYFLLYKLVLFILPVILGTISTYAGSLVIPPERFDDDATIFAIETQLRGPQGIWGDSLNNLYIADALNKVIRRVDFVTKGMTVFAGLQCSGNSCPQTSNDAKLAVNFVLTGPTAVIGDTQNNIYIADSASSRVMKVDHSTYMTTVLAGKYTTTCVATDKLVYFSGTLDRANYGDDGPASQAAFMSISALALDSSSNLYIVDTVASVVRKVTAASTNIITVSVGYDMYFGGDGGAATAATMQQPKSLWVTSVSDIYIADYGNNRVRKIDKLTGIITTVLGE